MITIDFHEIGINIISIGVGVFFLAGAYAIVRKVNYEIKCKK